MRLNEKKVVVLLAAGGICASFFCGCRTEVMAAREELAPATRDYISEYEGKEEDLAALNQRRKEAGKPPFGAASAKKNAAAKTASGRFEPMAPINPADLPKNPPAASSLSRAGTYKVVAGDNLTKIARRNHTTVSKLAAANHLNPNAKLYVGQKLVIPGGAAGTAAAPSPKGSSVAVRSSAAVSRGLYTVKPGDSIDRIARRAGVTRAALLEANHLSESSMLRVGQKLVIPSGSAVADPAAAATAAAAVKTEKPAKTAKAENKNVPQPSADKSTDDTLNNLIKDLGGTEEKAPAAGTKAAPADDALSTTEILNDIKVVDFAAHYDYSVEQLKAANRDNWPADGVFKAGTLIHLPQ